MSTAGEQGGPNMARRVTALEVEVVHKGNGIHGMDPTRFYARLTLL